jgi:hypothetical protein
MKKGTIDKLCAAINEARRVVYPQKGYLMFSDIRGDGMRRRRVYEIMNEGGGVVAVHNGSYRQTAKNLREVLTYAQKPRIVCVPRKPNDYSYLDHCY